MSGSGNRCRLSPGESLKEVSYETLGFTFFDHGGSRWVAGCCNLDPQFGAFVTNAQFKSAPHSLESAGPTDIVQEYAGISSGTWVYTDHVYVPTGYTGQSYFILLSGYDGANTIPRVWTVQMYFDMNLNRTVANCGSSALMKGALLYDQWMEIRVEIYLDDDWTKLYVEGKLLDDPALADHPTLGGGYKWTKGVFGTSNGTLDLMAVDVFANGATPVYHDDMSVEPFSTLSADVTSISEAAGGIVNFTLDAGSSNANRNYLMVGGVTGTSPGIPLPGGMATIPVNYDVFTGLVLALLNTPVYKDFLGVLDVNGEATAQFNTLGPFSGAAGLTLYFAYACNGPWNFASNSVAIGVVP